MKPHQQTLFNTEPMPWEQDDQVDQMVADVAFAKGPPEVYSYAIPDSLRGAVLPGCRVRVPLGRGDRLTSGYCVAVENRRAGPRRLKDIAAVIDQQPLLGPPMLRLTRWMAEHYICPLGAVLEAVVPSGVRERRGTREVTRLVVSPGVAERRAELKLSAKQALALDFIAAARRPVLPAEAAKAADCGPSTVRALVKKGLVEAVVERVDAGSLPESAAASGKPLTLNPDQRVALDVILAAISSGRHETILIHGVTGSGKTEVYMQAIGEVLSYGRQAIVLVPEISLTPQTEQRFRSRFGAVAVLHSHQSDADRRRHWEQIASGRVPLVVGARSAVFAPTPQLGLILLDEEHESSFKQDSAPRYHARDVALVRARAENVPLVLGSATPSLESWRRATGPPDAEGNRYRLVSMPRRVFDRPLPHVATIDLRAEFRQRGARGVISRALYSAMQDALSDGGQVILLLNRRGYSTHIQCQSCGQVLRCPHCEIALTHHLREEIALCHYCDFRSALPEDCPHCRFAGIRYGGTGTQRLEAEVKARFSAYRALRMDTDTMQSPGSHERALSAFHAGDVRILLGTQMIAKGLDFPNVTLVGVINADIALHLCDFRAAERTFQLVTQVAGRTGRGPKGGRVLVQTYSPDHPAIIAACRHDFGRFAGGELPLREEHSYPPYSEMIRIVLRGPSQDQTKAFAQAAGDRLNAILGERGVAARVLGPAPAPLAKLRGLHRFQIQVQSRDGGALRDAVREATSKLPPSGDVQWIVDVDPIDMM